MLVLAVSADAAYNFGIVASTDRIKIPLLPCLETLGRDQTPDSMHFFVLYQGTKHDTVTYSDFATSASAIKAKAYIDTFYMRGNTYLGLNAWVDSIDGDSGNGMYSGTVIFFKQYQQTPIGFSFVKADKSARAYAQGAPDSLLVTTWRSEHFSSDSSSKYFNGYSNPDSTNLVDWTPMFSWRVGKDSSWRYQIQVVKDTTDTTTAIWNTGKVTFAGNDTLNNGERTYRIKGDSTYMDELRDGYRYWWRCRTFYGAGETASAWSGWNSFWGVTPSWPTYASGLDSDIVECVNRKNIRFGGSHSALPTGYTVAAAFKTGYTFVLDSNATFNGSLDGSQQLAYHDGFLYAAYLGEDSIGSKLCYVNKYNFSTGQWSGRVLLYGAVDVHNFPALIIGQDNRLHVIGGAHHGQAKYYRTDSAHVAGSGINITMWDTMPDPTGASAMTYTRLVKTSAGHLFMFFRHIESAGKVCYAYIRNKWNGSGYEGWSSRRYVAYYYRNAYSTIYNGGCAVDQNDRLYLLIGWHDYYQEANKTRGVSLVYSDLDDDSTDFRYWFQFGSTDTIGKTTAAVDTILNITYSSVDKVLTAHQTDSIWSPSPFTNTPTLIADTQGVLMSFALDDYYGTGYGDQAAGRWPVPTLFARWNPEDSVYDIDCLTGDTKFQAKDFGNNDDYSVEIRQGSSSGIKVICAKDSDIYKTKGVTDSTSNTKYELSYPRGGSIVSDTTAYLDSVRVLVDDTVGTNIIRAAIYRRADSSFVDSTYHKTLAGTNTNYWANLKFVNGAQVKKDTSYVVMFNKISGNNVRVYRVASSGNIYWQSGTLSGSWPSKFTPSGTTSDRTLCFVLRTVSYAERDTFDNIDTPSELRDSINTLDYMRIAYLGISLPDTFSQTNFDSGGTNMKSYLIAPAASPHPRAWEYMTCGYMILEGKDLYVYSNVMPDSAEAGEYFGAELYEWKCSDVFAKNYSNRWSGRYLTRNSGGGSGRISVLSRALDNHPKQILRSRGDRLDHVNLNPFFGVRPDGNDVRIVMARNNNGVVSWHELHRVVDVFNKDSTIIYFKLPTSPATTVPADSLSAYAKVFQVYYGNEKAGEAKHHPDSVFEFYESFEDITSGTAINGYNSWLASSGVKAVSYYDKQTTVWAAKDYVWGGKKFVMAPDAGGQLVRRYMGNDLTDKEINIHIYAEWPRSTWQNMRFKNDNIWTGIRIMTNGDSLQYGDTTGWTASWPLENGRAYNLRFVINSNGLSGWRFDKQMFSNIGSMTAFDSLWIQLQANLYGFVFDVVQMKKWVASPPAIKYSATMSLLEGRRRRMIMMED